VKQAGGDLLGELFHQVLGFFVSFNIFWYFVYCHLGYGMFRLITMMENMSWQCHA
jgi:hypothetical protein